MNSYVLFCLFTTVEFERILILQKVAKTNNPPPQTIQQQQKTNKHAQSQMSAILLTGGKLFCILIAIQWKRIMPVL